MVDVYIRLAKLFKRLAGTFEIRAVQGDECIEGSFNFGLYLI